MSQPEKELPARHGERIYKLEGLARKQWWQWNAKKQNIFSNNAFRCTFVFMIQFPFVLIMSHYMKAHPVELWFQIFVWCVWLLMGYLMVAAIRRQLYTALEVRTTDDFIEFKSLKFLRRVRWVDITSFFEATNSEDGYCHFNLGAANGERFIIAREITDCSKLVDNIRAKMPPKLPSYEINYFVPQDFLEAAGLAGIALIVAALSSLRSLFTGPHQAGDIIAQLLTAGVLMAMGWAIWWLHHHKVAHIVQASNTELVVRTLSGTSTVAWEQLRKIQGLMGYTLVRSPHGWFIVFGSKKQPFVQKLLEHKKNLLTAKRLIT